MKQSGEDSKVCQWWIRTPGHHFNMAIFVDKEGSMDTEGHLVNYIEFGVRPAMWINLVEEPE